MAEFDVRNAVANAIDVVRFAGGTQYGVRVACTLEKYEGHQGCICIHDGGDFVLVTSKEHANNLKKALDKAIELGWLE